MLLTDRRDVLPEMDYLADKHRAASNAYGVEFDRALSAHWVARPPPPRPPSPICGAPVSAERPPKPRHRRSSAALGSLAPERLSEFAKRLAATERRSALRKLAAPEPDWVARFRT